MSGALGLYLHVPFCTRRCDYCDFYVVVGRERDRDPFVRQMADRIREGARGLAPGELRADTIYLGGGTPSLLTPEQVGVLLAACRDAFRIEDRAEITLEANPEGITQDRLAGWREAGVNRLSVGIQSLDDAELRDRGRLHTGAQGLASLRVAREAEFGNVAADLIAGLPERAGRIGEGRHFERVAAAVRRVLEERPDHLSLYMLETDKRTPLMQAVARGAVELPEDDEVAEAYLASVAAAEGAGYRRYEISSFCLPGRESRHNLKYWTGEAYLGFGPGAHSYFRGRRSATSRDLDSFLREGQGGDAGAGEAREEYTLELEAAAREALILNLRLIEGVDLEAFDRRWGTRVGRWLDRDLDEVFEAGLLLLRPGRLRLTDKGILLANEVFTRIARAPATGPPVLDRPPLTPLR